MACSLVFGCALIWRSLEDADFWLKVFSAVLGALIFVVGMAALITGHISGNRQGAEILALKTDLATAQIDLEKERVTRLELENSISPRILASSSDAIRRLQRLKGTRYILEFIPDVEAERLARRIAWVLALSDWEQLSSTRYFDRPIRDGLTIEAKAVDGETPPPVLELAEYFEANELWVWTLSNEAALANTSPEGVVVIKVGFRPAPYFEDKFPEGTKRTRQLLDGLAVPGLVHRTRSPEDVERLRSEWNLPKPQ